MNAVDKKILDKLKSILREQVSLHQLILFGSQARGDADPYSDLDVVIIVDGAVDESARAGISDCAWEAGFEHGVVIVPVVFSLDEWESGPESGSLLVQAVKAEGIPL